MRVYCIAPEKTVTTVAMSAARTGCFGWEHWDLETED